MFFFIILFLVIEGWVSFDIRKSFLIVRLGGWFEFDDGFRSRWLSFGEERYSGTVIFIGLGLVVGYSCGIIFGLKR